MCLAQARVAVDEEGVVQLRRRVGDTAARRAGELAVSSDDEAFERVPRVQASLAGALVRRPGFGRKRGWGLGYLGESDDLLHPLCSEFGEHETVGRAVMLETEIEGSAEHAAGQIAQKVAVLVLDPLHGEPRWRGNDQGVVCQADGLRGGEPRAERLLGQHVPRGGNDRSPDFGGRQLHGCPVEW